jgi:hypothetical protein
MVYKKSHLFAVNDRKSAADERSIALQKYIEGLIIFFFRPQNDDIRHTIY